MARGAGGSNFTKWATVPLIPHSHSFLLSHTLSLTPCIHSPLRSLFLFILAPFPQSPSLFVLSPSLLHHSFIHTQPLSRTLLHPLYLHSPPLIQSLSLSLYRPASFILSATFSFTVSFTRSLSLPQSLLIILCLISILSVTLPLLPSLSLPSPPPHCPQ